MKIMQSDLRDVIPSYDRSAQNTHRHGDQDDSENGVQLSNHLIDRKKRGQNIIQEDHDDPELLSQCFRREPGDQGGRTVHEHRSGEYKKNDGEDPHDPFGRISKIDAGHLGDGFAAVPAGDHAGHIIMHRTSQDRAANDPEEDDRAEASTHQCAEDRARAGDVQKLDKKCLPFLHGNTVHAIIDGDCRCFPVIRGKDLFDDLSIDKKTCKQYNQRNN